MIRLAGDRRFGGKFSDFDVILGITFGSMLSRAINGSAPFLVTIGAGFVLVGMNRLFAFIAGRSQRFNKLISGNSLLLVNNGEINWHNMHKGHVIQTDLQGAIRTNAHLSELSEVKVARLERSGQISVIPTERKPQAIEVTVEEGVQTVRIELEYKAEASTMNLMRTLVIYSVVVTITLLIILLSFCFPLFVNNYGVILVVILILGIGIPHGATDYVVDNYLSENTLNHYLKFYLFYLICVSLYLLTWYLFPSVSLAGFILISSYNLGQSNLYYLSLPDKVLTSFIYSLWGLFAVLGPIFANVQQVLAILESFFSTIWIEGLVNQEYLLIVLIGLNFLTISMLFIFHYATEKEFIQEALNLSLLGLLFYSAPLLVSFGVYFGLWHSLGSTFDQIQLIRKYNQKFSFSDFYLCSLPLSVVSILGFIAGYLFLAHYNVTAQNDLNSLTCLFFIGIAALTVPHTFVRNKIYANI